MNWFFEYFLKLGAGITVNKKQGTATLASGKPATKYQIKPTVIKTGPGVIIVTLTASLNCRCVYQWLSVTTPASKNGTIAKSLPKINAPALVKKMAIFVTVELS